MNFLLNANWFAWLSGLVAFLSMLWITPLVVYLAHRMDWLSHPQTDRWHEKPTALMGGIAIYSAATLSLGVLWNQGISWVIWFGATLMFLTGLVDDLKNIKPATKFMAQVVAASLLILEGYQFASNWPVWLSLPLTFLWIIGITNALNLLDNMDGLAGGIAAIAAGVLAAFFMLSGDVVGAIMPLAVAGAASGFLIFNFKPARIFMGDCGSLFLGYTIAALALTAQSKASSASVFFVLLIPIAVMAVPIFDTTLVTIVRIFSGRSISQGGRDHSSHRLVFLGFSESKAVITLYGVSLLFGLLALLLYFTSVGFFVATLVFGSVGLAILGIYLGSINVYDSDAVTIELEKKENSKNRVLLHSLFFLHKKLLAGIVADILLIIASFTFAYYLRFEGKISYEQAQWLSMALPLIVILKLPVFHYFGLYHSIWRHAGTSEVIKISIASSVASILSFFVIWAVYGESHLSWAVFVIDWFLTANSVGGARLAFRGLPQYFASQRRIGRRVLLYGAGDGGELSLREIRQNAVLALNPIGFIDDDPLKQRSSVQGIGVLGGFNEVVALFQQYKIDEILITSPSMSEERKKTIRSHCQQHGIICREFQLQFSPVSANVADSESERYNQTSSEFFDSKISLKKNHVSENVSLPESELSSLTILKNYIKEGNTQAVEELLKRIGDTLPKAMQWYAKGTIHGNRQEGREALKCYLKTLSQLHTLRDSDDRDYIYIRATRATAITKCKLGEDYEGAIQLLEELLSHSALQHNELLAKQVRITQTVIHYYKKDYITVIEQLEKFVAQCPNDEHISLSQAYLFLALSYAQQQEKDSVEKFFQHALSHFQQLSSKQLDNWHFLYGWMGWGKLTQELEQLVHEVVDRDFAESVMSSFQNGLLLYEIVNQDPARPFVQTEALKQTIIEQLTRPTRDSKHHLKVHAVK
ncbi:MAG: hypothetical protein HQM14_19150 [SAR324 cluster bacterium]|nr:hypothetical protein [SAR324 cluster bacterium]